MEELRSFFDQVVVPALVTILTAAVTALVGVAVAAIRSWAEKQHSEWIEQVVKTATDAVITAVESVNQTFADEIRLAAEDGKLTPEEAKAAANMAYRRALEVMGTSTWAALLRIFDGTSGAEGFIRNQIEAAVSDAKAGLPYRVGAVQVAKKKLAEAGAD